MDGENIALLVIIGLVAFIILFFNLPNIFGSLIGLPGEKRKAQSAAIEYEKKTKEYEKREIDLTARENALLEKERSFNKQVEEIERLKEEAEEYTKKVISRVDKYIEQKCNSFPFLAGMMADFLTLHYEKSARFLQQKQRPAYVESYRIEALKEETLEIIKQKKILEYKLAYIKKLFPDIEEVFSPDFDGDPSSIESLEEQKRKLALEYEKKVEFLEEQKRKLTLEYEKKVELLGYREEQIERGAAKLKREERRIERAQEELEAYNAKFHARLEEVISQKADDFPFVAAIMADLLTIHYEKSARILEIKSRPAKTEASRIRELANETREILSEKKVLEYKLAYIEKLFPNINDIFDSGFAEENFTLETADDTDRVRLFLSEEEYRSLSTTARNQLALDRYVASRKSRWQVGRDYEMYIGLCIEKRGFSVQYTGIIQKLEDMGRDLIATKGRSCYIVQCKNWSQEKTIHEKHVFQLYGTSILYQIDHPRASVQPVFVTSAELSETAKKVAEVLGVTVLENIALKEFPRIKCNINRTNGMRIYHLPFDQQYDRTVIEENHGEFYALTVDEAESKGFRRAWKHYH